MESVVFSITAHARRVGYRGAAAGTIAVGLAAGVAAFASGGSAAIAKSSPAAKTALATAPGNATSGTITWWASPINTSGPDVRKVWITAFEKAYPKIKVNLISAPTDTDTNRATLTTQISGGAGPDVFMGDVIWPAQFGAHQLAVPLSKYLPASYWSTFAPGLVAGATYKGQVYGAPLFEDQGFLYYRKDLLAKDHLAVPTTWEQLESDAKTIQAKKQTKYGYVFEGADYEGATCDFMEFLTRRRRQGAQQHRDEVGSDGQRRRAEGADVRAFAGHQWRQPVGRVDVPGAAGDDRLPGRTGRLPAQLGLRVRDVEREGVRRDRQGRCRSAADVPGQSYPGLLEHRGLEPVRQPALEEHRRGPDVRQVDDGRRGPDDPGDAVLADPDDHRRA